MTELVQIEPAEKVYHKRRMKDGSGEFLAKKTDGGRWYYLILPGGQRQRNLAKVVEDLSEEVK